MVEKTIFEKIVNNENIEVLIEDGNKRLVKRFSFYKGKNKKTENCLLLSGEEKV